MDVVLWIIAGLSLIGGTFMALDEKRVVWFVSGIISFALFGGFASVVGLLKEQLSKLSEVKDELAQLRQERTLEAVVHYFACEMEIELSVIAGA